MTKRGRTSSAVAAVLLLSGDVLAREEKGAKAGETKNAFVVIAGGTKCPHQAGPSGHSFYKNLDSIRWAIVSACPDDQKVLLCVYKHGLRKNPFAPCESDDPARDIEKTFTVSFLGHADLTCKALGDPSAKEKETYVKVVFTGKEVPSGGCPDVKPKTLAKPGTLTHQLDIEILP